MHQMVSGTLGEISARMLQKCVHEGFCVTESVDPSVRAEAEVSAMDGRYAEILCEGEAFAQILAVLRLPRIGRSQAASSVEIRRTGLRQWQRTLRLPASFSVNAPGPPAIRFLKSYQTNLHCNLSQQTDRPLDCSPSHPYPPARHAAVSVNPS